MFVTKKVNKKRIVQPASIKLDADKFLSDLSQLSSVSLNPRIEKFLSKRLDETTESLLEEVERPRMTITVAINEAVAVQCRSS